MTRRPPHNSCFRVGQRRNRKRESSVLLLCCPRHCGGAWHGGTRWYNAVSLPARGLNVVQPGGACCAGAALCWKYAAPYSTECAGILLLWDRA